MPLTNPTYGIVLMRSKEASQAVIGDYQAFGYPVAISPCMEIIHDHPMTVGEARASLIITSQNALHALSPYAKETPVYCVGKSTAQHIQSLGFQTIFWQPTAQALLSHLRTRSETFTYLRGDSVTVDMATALPKCQDHIVYRTRPNTVLHDDALTLIESASTTIVPVYSRQSFQMINKILNQHGVNLKKVALVTIGDFCDLQISAPYGCVMISQRPEHHGMLTTVEGYIRKRDKTYE